MYLLLHGLYGQPNIWGWGVVVNSTEQACKLNKAKTEAIIVPAENAQHGEGWETQTWRDEKVKRRRAGGETGWRPPA